MTRKHILIVLSTFLFVISIEVEASLSFAGQWECTVRGNAPLDLEIEEMQLPDSKLALEISPALSLAHKHKGLLVIGSNQREEQKDYFEDEVVANSGMYNLIRNIDSVSLDKDVLRVTSIESYHRSEVNNGIEGPVILQSKVHEIMKFRLLSHQKMHILEFTSQDLIGKPKLTMKRICVRK